MGSLCGPFKEMDIQPKILLKNRTEPETATATATSTSASSVPPSGGVGAAQIAPTVILNKNTISPGAIRSPRQSPVVRREATATSASAGSTALNSTANVHCPPQSGFVGTATGSGVGGAGVVQQWLEGQTGESSTTGVHDANANNASAAMGSAVEMPRMTKAMAINAVDYLGKSGRKVLLKGNTEFMVVGIVGCQGTGKSTIMNLLASEDLENSDFYRHIFMGEDHKFPIRQKSKKLGSTRTRAETIQMYITSDRIILLDTPSVQCNSHRKDNIIQSELDDFRLMITLLSICHILIVVIDDYLDLNFFKSLRLAELMKPHDSKSAFGSCDYMPQVLFVKNRAKRVDFVPTEKLTLERILTAFFKDSDLRILRGNSTIDRKPRICTTITETTNPLTSNATVSTNSAPPTNSVTTNTTKNRKNRSSENERLFRVFLLPEFESGKATAYHYSLVDIVKELRAIIFRLPDTKPSTGSETELTEESWFEWYTHVSHYTDHFHVKTYESIHRQHLDIHTTDPTSASPNVFPQSDGDD